jgi:hypothetical protein
MFAAASRTSKQYGDNCVSPAEEQLPGAITQGLFDANESASAASRAIELYSTSLSVFSTPTPQTDDDIVPAATVKIRPERGRFQYAPSQSPPLASPPSSVPPGVWASYCYGLSSEIGAGPYDRRLGRPAPATPLPLDNRSAGGAGLTLTAIPSSGTLSINHSLTYNGAGPIGVSGALTIAAANKQRPVIRLPAGGSGEWVITGAPESSLVLDGLLISGGDIVLAGSFVSVTITCCTLDTGTSIEQIGTSPPQVTYAMWADGRPLGPTRLWIEAKIETLAIERSITGPIHTRNGGSVQLTCAQNTGPLDDIESPIRFEGFDEEEAFQ